MLKPEYKGLVTYEQGDTFVYNAANTPAGTIK